jgi:hypothetical protein
LIDIAKANKKSETAKAKLYETTDIYDKKHNIWSNFVS